MNTIVILDFGSQYAHLIAKRFRALGWYAEIALPSVEVDSIANAKGIVLSGGPSSVFEANIPQFNSAIMELDIPILGLCYGHQLMAQYYGGTVERGKVGEFGLASLDAPQGATLPAAQNPLFSPHDPLSAVAFPAQVWMSHQDDVTCVPAGFEIAASTKDCSAAALVNLAKKRFSLQFHVEVRDTLCGDTILANFARFCGMEKNWNQNVVQERILRRIAADAAGKKVLLFLSGGVDSTVAFALLNTALGKERVLGLHIDNGFMRKNESAIIAERYRSFGFDNFIVEDASVRFLQAVKGETDPQKKRIAIGETFITVRNEVASRLNLNEDEWLLAQGTLYPDIIESGGTKNAHTIKTHHNRVQGIQALIEKGLVIEPLKDLYKDEVRVIGSNLGLPDDLVLRHPFPGPGLSINVLCSNGTLDTAEDFAAAKKSLVSFPFGDFFLPKDAARLCVTVLPVKSVGVQGDFRTYRFPAALSFQNADVLPDAGESFGTNGLPDWDTLEQASAAITNNVKQVNRAILTLFVRKAGENVDSNDGSTSVKLALQAGYCDKARLDQTREVDAIVLAELKKAGWYRRIFQHLTINLPYASRAGQCAIVLRPVVSEDVMTARFAHLDFKILSQITAQIAALPFVDAIYYDITNKPPATFGWE